jgi:hypothetical protein
MGCYAGRFFAIEVKVPGNTTTALQDREIANWRAAKGLVLVAYSVEDVTAFMHEAFLFPQKRPGGL